MINKKAIDFYQRLSKLAADENVNDFTEVFISGISGPDEVEDEVFDRFIFACKPKLEEKIKEAQGESDSMLKVVGKVLPEGLLDSSDLSSIGEKLAESLSEYTEPAKLLMSIISDYEEFFEKIPAKDEDDKKEAEISLDKSRKVFREKLRVMLENDKPRHRLCRDCVINTMKIVLQENYYEYIGSN